tara:strand:+ start:4190 stop:5332 length:1143 start_codon:yes stop_codon:yes gene_type:complete
MTLKIKSLSLGIKLNINKINMDNSLIEKKIIKYYIKAKESNDNKELYQNFLNKTLKNINLLAEPNRKISFKLLDDKYFNSIKKYCYQNLDRIFNDSILKFDKKVDIKIFDLINQGDIQSINETENIYNYNVFNEDGLTPLHRCINLGDTYILKEFLKRGESIDSVNKSGNTLLEYACLQNDPNLISFILNHGGSMKKHLFFREDFKLKLNLNDIDLAIIIKLCLLKGKDYQIDYNIDFLLDYIEPDFNIGISDIKFCQFLEFLKSTISNLKKETQETIITIWKEELTYNLENKLGCPDNYFELILINLVPFINYPFNLSNKNYLTKEVLIMVKKLCLENNYKLDQNLGVKLIETVWKEYKNIYPVDFIGLILSNILLKIK